MLARITAHPEMHTSNENENIRRDGRRVWVHWANQAVRDDRGNVTEILCVGTDITERKKTQQALEAYHAELGQLSSQLVLAEEGARRQLAVALHDSVGQTLALAKIKLGSLGQMITESETKKMLAEIRNMFNEALRQTRTLSFDLSPPILYELGLGAAVEWLGEDFEERHDLRVYLQGTNQKYEISESVSILFFQSVRELLTNIVKHAEATEVRISFTENNGHLVIEIVDNGKGFDPGILNPQADGGKASLGLFSIHERMKNMGGIFEIQPLPEHGTMAKLSAPMWNHDRQQNKAG